MKYLVPFDFSSVSKSAVNNAIKLLESQEGELSLLHIVHEKEEIRKQELLLRDYASTLKLGAKINLTTHVVVGDVLDDIGKIAKYHGVDYIVMGTHGVDTMQKLFGSNAVHIIKHSSVPFIVFQENAKVDKIKKIVLPFSIDTKSMQVIKFAAKICKLYNSELILLGRNHTDEVFKHKEDATVIMAEKYLIERGVKYQIKMVTSSETDFPYFIEEYAKEIGADLIAATYYSDALFTIFEKFVQNLIVNKHNIPVLCLNAQSLSSSSSVMSVMTN